MFLAETSPLEADACERVSEAPVTSVPVASAGSGHISAQTSRAHLLSLAEKENPWLTMSKSSNSTIS